MVCGEVLQIALKGVYRSIENLALECIVASKVTLPMAHGCQLELGVQQGGDEKKRTHALNKAIGLARGRRTLVQ